MFQAPSLIALSIAATRMHRSLTDFVAVRVDTWEILSSSALTVDNDLLNSNSNVEQLHCNQTPAIWIQATTDISDSSESLQTIQHDLSIKTEQPLEKPSGDEPQPRAVEPV
jgi:hypothetical protein